MDETHTWARAALRACLKRCVRAIATEAELLARLESERAK